MAIRCPECRSFDVCPVTSLRDEWWCPSCCGWFVLIHGALKR